MAGLKDYPYKFNETTILFPLTWNETFTTIEDVQTSESGKDLVTVARYNKLTVSASFKVTSTWLATFKSFSTEPYFDLKRYDAVQGGYKTHKVRMRGFTVNRVPHSEDIAVTMGIWEVSFTLEEF